MSATCREVATAAAAPYLGNSNFLTRSYVFFQLGEPIFVALNFRRLRLQDSFIFF